MSSTEHRPAAWTCPCTPRPSARGAQRATSRVWLHPSLGATGMHSTAIFGEDPRHWELGRSHHGHVTEGRALTPQTVQERSC